MTVEARVNRRILVHISELAAALAVHRDTEDVYTVSLLVPRSLAAVHADVIDAHALLHKRISGATRSGIKRIGRQHDQSYPLAVEMLILRSGYPLTGQLTCVRWNRGVGDSGRRAYALARFESLFVRTDHKTEAA